MTPEELRTRSAQKVAKKKPRAKEAPKEMKETAKEVKEVTKEGKEPTRDAKESREVKDSPREEQVIVENQPQAAPPKAESRVNADMGDEYLWQVYFDKLANRYYGSVLEFPEVRAEASSREALIQELSHQIQQKLVAMKMAGERAPEPIVQKTYPDKLSVSISQALYRKLDIYSRQERVGLEQLVGEVLSGLVERRGQRPQQNQQPQQHDRDRDRDRGGQQRYQQHRHNNNNHRGGGGQQRQGGGYHQSMESGDNFMEYVRNLEKRGGAPGKFRR